MPADADPQPGADDGVAAQAGLDGSWRGDGGGDGTAALARVPAQLLQRLEALEAEVAALRTRVQALEGDPADEAVRDDGEAAGTV